MLAANISFTVSKQKEHTANTLQVKLVLWKQDDYVITVKILHQIICSLHRLYNNSKSRSLSFIANKYRVIMFLHFSHLMVLNFLALYIASNSVMGSFSMKGHLNDNFI